MPVAGHFCAPTQRCYQQEEGLREEPSVLPEEGLVGHVLLCGPVHSADVLRDLMQPLRSCLRYSDASECPAVLLMQPEMPTNDVWQVHPIPSFEEAMAMRTHLHCFPPRLHDVLMPSPSNLGPNRFQAASSFPRVYFKLGDCAEVVDLLGAWVESAGYVIVACSGKQSGPKHAETMYDDARALLAYRLLAAWPGLSAIVVGHLTNPGSFDFLGPSRPADRSADSYRGQRAGSPPVYLIAATLVQRCLPLLRQGWSQNRSRVSLTKRVTARGPGIGLRIMSHQKVGRFAPTLLAHPVPFLYILPDLASKPPPSLTRQSDALATFRFGADNPAMAH